MDGVAAITDSMVELSEETRGSEGELVMESFSDDCVLDGRKYWSRFRLVSVGSAGVGVTLSVTSFSSSWNRGFGVMASITRTFSSTCLAYFWLLFTLCSTCFVPDFTTSGEKRDVCVGSSPP